jgi:hypothetical protein
VSLARAVNLRREDCDVRVDRRTRWGNPFVIGRDGDRAEVIARYRAHLDAELAAGRITRAELAELHGKRLGCWCAPAPCHGDVLAAAAAAAHAVLADDSAWFKEPGRWFERMRRAGCDELVEARGAP